MMSVAAEQIPALIAIGAYWWSRADGTVYATADYTPESPSDTYLLRASEQWLSQWDGDWTSAAEQINTAITQQEA